MTTGETLVLTRWTFVGKVMSLLFNMLSRLVIAFLPRSKLLLVSWLWSPYAAYHVTPWLLCTQLLSCVRLFATPWTVACQAPLSMEILQVRIQSGLPCPPPGDLPNPGIKPRYPTLQAVSLPSRPPGKPLQLCPSLVIKKLLVPGMPCLISWIPRTKCNLVSSSYNWKQSDNGLLDQGAKHDCRRGHWQQQFVQSLKSAATVLINSIQNAKFIFIQMVKHLLLLTFGRADVTL